MIIGDVASERFITSKFCNHEKGVLHELPGLTGKKAIVS